MRRSSILLGTSGILLGASLLVCLRFFPTIAPRLSKEAKEVLPQKEKIRVPSFHEVLEKAKEALPEGRAIYPTEPQGTAPTTPNLSEIVEDELKKLSHGQILFNPSQEMKVGVKERVEVRIAKTIIEDLSAGLRGRGVPQIEKIRVGTFMRVCLMGDNFHIKALSDDGQPVTGEGFTQWDWDVVPLKSGIQSLLLSVAVRIKIPNFDEERKDYPVFERKIKVKVNPTYSIISFIKNCWQWIVATITGSGLIGWVIKKQRKSRKKM